MNVGVINRYGEEQSYGKTRRKGSITSVPRDATFVLLPHFVYKFQKYI